MSKGRQLDPAAQRRMLIGFYAVFMLLFMAAAAGLIIYGIIVPNKLSDEYKSYTATATATVTENRIVEITTHSGTTGHSNKKKKGYVPVYSFTVDGKEYTGISNAAQNPAKYSVGDKVEIHYDPANPKKNYLKDISGTLRIICIGAGAVFMIVGIFMGRALIKTVRQ